MYAREVDGESRSLGVSGMLWRDALVFYDRETGTLWSQVDGRAILGPQAGSRLEELPSEVTTWAEWRAKHPDTLVLRPDVESRRGSPYEDYLQDPDRLGIFGARNPDSRLPGKTLVLGVVAQGRGGAVPLETLVAQRWTQGTVAGTPVLVVATSSGDGRAYDRRLESRTLEFVAAQGNRLKDCATGSLWNPESGEAVSGPLAGKRLGRLPSRRVFWFVWARFHPEGEILQPSPAPGKCPD